MKYTYPHKIDNGSGEELTFLQEIRSGEESMVEIENRVHPGSGPPMHVHYLQDESLTVIQGTIGAQVAGRAPTIHGVGETVEFKRGEVHRFWNAGQDILICRGWAKPAYNLEYFLTQIYQSTKANGGKAPSAFDAAFLLSKYKTEFGMTAIPAFVQTFIFPVIRFLGKLAGKYKKFEGAPDATIV